MSTAEETQIYLKGLSYFWLAQAAELPSDKRFASLQVAFACLQQAVEARPAWARRCSLARVAAALGHRQISVQTLQDLSRALVADRPYSMDEPFLPVHSQYDQQSPPENWQDWLLVSILETYESSRAFSSYFSPQESVAILSQVVQTPAHSHQADHRLRLAKQLLAASHTTPVEDAPLSGDAPFLNANPPANKNLSDVSGRYSIVDLFTPPRLSIVDIGAMEIDGLEDRLVSLAKRGLATMIGFEPLLEECVKLNQKSDGSRRYLPYAIADGSPRTLYVTNTGMTSSLLPPNPDVTSLFMNLQELMQVVRTEAVATQRLDDIPEILEAGCDLLKVDVQGLEFEIFCNATKILANCLAVQTEVEFVPLYQNQPLFAEVDQVLRQHGFVFHKFLGLAGRPFKPLMQNNNPNASISQVLWSDVVYVRDFTQLDRLTPEQLLKLVTLLHELYGSVDLCHHILTIYDKQTGETLASKYLTQQLI